MKKRILSLVMAFIMILGMLPTNMLTVAAADTTPVVAKEINEGDPVDYSESNGAVQYLKNGDYLYEVKYTNLANVSKVEFGCFFSSTGALYFEVNEASVYCYLSKTPASTTGVGDATHNDLPTTSGNSLNLYGWTGSSYISDTTKPIVIITCLAVGDPTWDWAADYSSASAKFTSTDNKAYMAVTASVTSETTSTAANCSEKDKITYTATVTRLNQQYTDTQTVDGAAGPHTYSYSVSGTTITETCSNGCGHSGTAILSASDKTYDTTAYNGASVTTNNFHGTVPTTTYEGTGTTTYEKSTTPPSAIGTYKATVATPDNTGSVSAEFAITFIPVTGIDGTVPTEGWVGTNITLPTTVIPTDASYQTVVWSVVDAGDTGATISGNRLNAKNAGTATIQATVENGTAYGTAYSTQVYTVTFKSMETIDISQGSVTIEKKDDQTLTVHYSPFDGQSKDYGINDPIVITGTTDSNSITVSSGTANITLDNINISRNGAGISISSGAAANLTLVGNNSLSSSSASYAALHVPSGAAVTIDGEGSLTAQNTYTTGYSAAGIGGGYEGTCGSITINGGTVTAAGGYRAAGIGGGASSDGGTVTITGGIVTATGGELGAGIGGGSDSDGGNITITGGTITATGVGSSGSSGGAGIGGGYAGAGGTIIITGGNIKAASTGKGSAVGAGYNGSGGTVTDGKGNAVSLNEITLNGVTEQIAVTAIDGITYGYNDVYTLDYNKLYFYLTNDAAAQTIHVTVDTYYYYEPGVYCVVDHSASTDFDYEPNETDSTKHDVFYKCCGVVKDSEGHTFVNGVCSCGATEGLITDSNGFYLIYNVVNLIDFANLVNNGNTTAKARLMNDIDASNSAFPMIGTSTNYYQGAFDGNGHTLTLNLSGANHTGFVRYANGVTISNLTLAGEMTSSGMYSGCFIAWIKADSSNTIEKCVSKMELNFTYTSSSDPYGMNSGFVGWSTGSLTITNSAFVGKITGAENSQGNSGFMGCCAGGSTTISNCYIAADFSGHSNTTLCKTFGNSTSGKLTIDNSYYLNAFGGVQGTQAKAEQFASGEVAYLLNNKTSEGDLAWGQNIDNGKTPDAYPVLGGATVYYDGTKYTNSLHDHSWTYTKVDGENKITATCSADGCTNTDGGSVTVTMPTGNQIHTGSAIAPAVVVYSDDWQPTGKPEMVYTNNTNLGTATGTLELGDATITVNFDIVAEIKLNANGGSGTFESLYTNTSGKLQGNLPTNVGHDSLYFSGWYTEQTGGTKIEDDHTFTGSTTIYAQFVDHQHNWTYSDETTGDATITATCSGCAANDGTNYVVTITLGKPAMTIYGDGNDANATVTQSVANTFTGLTPEYSGTKADNSAYAESTTAPTDAGTYTATLTMGSATAEVTYTIEAKELTADMVTLSPENSAYKANGDYGITVEVKDGSTLTEGTHYTMSWSPATFNGVGDYTLTVTGKGNYTGSVTKTFTITKATIADTNVTAPTAKENLVYKNTDQELVTAGGSPDGTTMQYALGTDTATAPVEGWSTSVPEGTNADTYYVWYKVVGGTNYEDTAAKCITVTIAKADVTGDEYTKASGSLIKGSTSDVNLPTLRDGAAYGTPTFSTPVTNATISNGVLTVTGGDGVTAGVSYTVTIPVAETTNYNAYEITVTLTGVVHEHAWTYEASGNVITATCNSATGTCPVTGKKVTLTLTADSLEYDGNAKKATVTPSVSGVFGSSDIVVKYSGTKADNSAYAESTTAPTDAGTYTATLTMGEGTEAKTAEVKFTIAPKSIEDTDVELSATTATYNGNDQTPTVTVTGLTVDKDYTVSWDKTEIKEVGTYTVTVTGIGNYDDTVTKTFTISECTHTNWTDGACDNCKVTCATLGHDFSGTNGACTHDCGYYGGYCGDTAVNDGKNVTWLLDPNGNMTISGTGAMMDCSIAYQPWENIQSNVVNVTIESGITHINKYVFYNCSKLQKVTIPDSVTTIGESAFTECQKLNNVTIPGSVTTIDMSAFGECTSLISATYLGTEDPSVNSTVFISCTALTAVNVPCGYQGETFGGKPVNKPDHKLTYSSNDTQDSITADCDNCNYTVTYTLTVPTDVTYNGASTVKPSFAPTADTNAPVIKIDGTALAEWTPAAGDFTVTMALGDKTVTADYSVAKKSLTPSIGGSVEKTYDGDTSVTGATTNTLKIVLDGVAVGDEASVSAVATFAYASATAGTTTVNATGITLSGGKAKNYELTATTATAAVGTITKANPGYTKPTGLTATYGDTLADVKLPEGFTWEAATTTSVGDAGDRSFTVKYTPSDTTNYNTITGIEVTIAVNKANVTVQAPTANTLTYTGKDQALVTKGSVVGGTFQYALSETGTYSENIPTGNGAATYTVWYKVIGDSNHNGTGPKSVTVTIAKAKAVITVDTTPINVPYGQTVTLPTASSNFGTVTCNKTAADLVNADTYTVIYSVEGTDNYDGDTKTLTVTVGQIAVAEPAVTGTYTYTGGEQTVVLTGVESYMTVVSGNKGTNAGNYEVEISLDRNHKWAEGFDGKIQWSIGKAKAVISVDTDPITVTYGDTVMLPTASSNFGTVTCNKTAADLVNADTYTVTYSVAATDNYDGDSVSITVIVNKADATCTAPAANEGLIYSGEDQALITAGTPTGGKMQYSLDSSTWDTEIPTGKNADTYTVYYKVVGDKNHNDSAVQSVTVTIAEKKIMAVVSAGEKTYDGNTAATVTATVSASDLVGADSITITGLFGTFADANVGTGITVTVSGTPQYSGTGYENYDVTIPETATANITARSLDNAVLSLDQTSFVYGDGAKAPVLTVTDTLNGESVKLTLDTDYSLDADSQNSGTNVGTYTIKITGKGNYKDSATITWSITTAEMDVSAADVEVDYNEAKHSIKVTGAPSGATITYSYDGSAYTTTNPTFTEVGVYTVSYKVTCDNYADASGSATVTIKIINQTAPAAPTGTAKTATTIELNAITTTGHGDVEYACSTTDTAPNDGWQKSTTFTGLTKNTTYYFFARYAGDKNHNPAVSEGTAITTLNTYTITYDLNNGTGDTPTAQTQDVGVAFTTVTDDDFSRTGYSFLGWATSDDATAAEYAEGTSVSGITADTKLYAVWKIVTYSISYDLDKGTVGGTNPKEYTVESDDITLINPTRTGYTFAGWTGTDLDGATKTVTIANGSIGDRNYTATWTANTNTEYTVKHMIENLDGNGYTQYGNDEVLTGTTDAKTKATATSIEGFTAPTTITQVNIDGDGSTVVEIKYTRNSYDLTFDLDNGTVATTETLKYGAEITVPTGFTKAGYTFKAWNTTIPDTMPASDVTYTALWTANTDTKYTVKHMIENLDGNGYTQHGNDEVLTGTTDTQTAAKALSIEGFTAPETITQVNIDGDGNAVVEIKYTRNSYNLTFDLDNGTTATPVPTKYGASITAPTGFTKTGYTFDKWSEIVAKTMPAGDVTYTALWTANTYTVKFDANVPADSELISGTMAEQTLTYDKEEALTANTFAVKGYTFAGWTWNNTSYSDKQAVKNLASEQGDEITMKAVWDPADGVSYTVKHMIEKLDGSGYEVYETDTTRTGKTGTETIAEAITIEGFTAPKTITQVKIKGDGSTVVEIKYTRNSYDLTFDLDNGTTATTVPTKYGAAITAPTGFKKAGYTFNGWDKEIPATMPADDVTYTAQWTANTDTKYTVKHMIEDLDGNGYSQYGEAEVLTGTTDTQTAAKALSIEGFTAPTTITQVNIDGDGNAVVVINYTRNSYDLTFDLDNGTVATTVSTKYGASITAPTGFTKTGYTFDKWSEEIPGTMPASDVTYTALWTANTYTVKFDANVPADSELISGTMAEQTLTYDKEEALTANSFAVKGYTFAGWTWNNTSYSDKQTVKNLASEQGDEITMKAVWDPADGVSYTVKHMIEKLDGSGYEVYETDTTRSGKTGTDTNAIKIDITGFTVVEPITQQTIKGDGSTVVEIFYSRNSYKLTFDPANGSEATVTTVKFEDVITKPADPEKTGHTFGGWNPTVAETMPASDVTYTAQWTANTYTVTLVTNRGTIREGDVTEYTYGVGATLPTKVYRAGFYFDGWYDNEDCKGTAITEISETDIGDKTFYAKWNIIIIPTTPTYPPVIEDGDGGDVVVTPAKPEKGDTVIITPDPDLGKEVDTVVVIDENGNPVTVTDNGDGTYSFEQPKGKVTILVTFKDAMTSVTGCKQDKTCPMHGFTDLDVTAWYHDGVHFCIENDLMNGTGATTFAPGTTLTRSMLVTILWRLEGEPVVNYLMNFDDVTEGKWYSEAIRWAASEGIVNGYGNGLFGTNDNITREQLATILYRYEQYKGGGFTGAWMIRMDYVDLADVSDWAYEAMCWMNMNGIINGKPGKVLDPKGSATRAEAATMLYRYCDVMTKEEEN